MNTLTSSNIWFAIDIDCGSTETLANMYLNNGHIRFTTDNYDPVVTSATYEDTTPVSGVWYKDALKLDGLDDTLINIDLAYGTGYSTLNGWSFSIINRCVNGAPFHKAILDTTSTYLLGSNITLYVVIDNVFYKRWAGIVSDYAISEDYFKINADDRFIKNYNLFPKTTIGATNYPYALTDSVGKIIPVCLGDVKYAKPINIENQELNFKIGTSFPLIRIKPDMTTGENGNYYLQFGIPNYDSFLNDQFTAFSDIIMKTGDETDVRLIVNYYTIVNNKHTAICITMPKSFDTSTLVGKYVTMSNTAIINADVTKVPKSMKIVSVGNATTTKLDISDTYLVYILVDGTIEGVSDYTNFYGDVTDYTLANFDEMSTDSMYVYIWDVSNKYILSENDITIVNSFTSNDKVISQEGDITCYKMYGDSKIFKFNPLNVTSVNARTLTMIEGTTEVYHIPDTALWFRYNPATDPTFIENKGTSVSNKILNSKITWDDDQLLNTRKVPYNTQETTVVDPLPLYNQNSEQFLEQMNTTDNVLAFIMSYNIDTFNPALYTRVLPTPIWNTGTYMYDGVHGHWKGQDNKTIWKTRSEVYGITDSTFNGKILTASMGAIESPISRVRQGYHINLPDTMPDAYGFMSVSIPNALSNALIYPDPVYTDDMLGNVFHGNDFGSIINNCDVYGKCKFGVTYPNKDGNYSSYVGGQSELREKFILDSQLSSTVSDINSNLWDSFDADGNISMVLELTSIGPTGDESSNWGGSDIVKWSHKTVHCLGLTGYIDYSPSDLYVRLHGECLATVPNAFDLILTTYNGINYVGRTNLITYRGDWNIGRQVTEQQNSLVYINELCAQSWVVGWTNRNGDVQLKAIEDKSVSYTHTDNIILRDSIKNFNLTPLTKVCNELTINADYNNVTGKYDKIYSVDNIDQDAFPIAYDGKDNQLKLQNNINYDTYTSIQSYVDNDFMVLALQNTHYNGIIQVGDNIRVNPFDILVYDTDSHTTLLASYYYDGNTYATVNAPFGGAIKGTEGQSNLIVDEIILDTPTVGWTYIHCKKSDVTGVLADVLVSYPNAHIQLASYYSEITKSDPNSDSATWKSWVQGIDSYGDAKDIWSTCKNAWFENKTINKYPDTLSNLSWFNNRNNFYDVTTYDETTESAYMFFKKAITWCTRQKYKLVYQVPLTSDTVKLDLMDTINFHDPILTGFQSGDPSYLNGSITSISCKPFEKVLEIEITAEMKYITPAPMPVNGDIIELSTNIDDIIESSTNTDDIIEG